ELGRWANVVVSAAILFIVVIALAGLGFVVVKALGGDDVKLARGTEITLPPGQSLPAPSVKGGSALYLFPGHCQIRFTAEGTPTRRSEAFQVEVPASAELHADDQGKVTLPDGCKQLVPGSPWGTFTIVCTIPIALFMALYTYRLRKGRVVEASL